MKGAGYAFCSVFLVLATTHLLWPSGGLNLVGGLAWWDGDDLNTFNLTRKILTEIRGPRLIAAMLSGGGLATAGCLSQAMFRNSLASPSVLGISGASSFFACLAFFLGLGVYQSAVVPIAAIFGAYFNLFLLYLLMRRGGSWQIQRLLLAGLALSALWGSLSSLLMSLAVSDYYKLRAIMHWQLGGLSAMTWKHCCFLLVPVIVGIVLALRRSRSLDILMLGEETAQSLGVDVLRLKQFCFFTISLLVAGVVSVVGLLPFVGLLVPHLTRMALGAHHEPLLKYSVLNGASLTVFADLLARSLNAPEEMDIGVFTSLLGAPFFIFMLWQRGLSR